jgi:monofunctional biosynthetic peptidoglycan transglycosylase
MSALRARLRSKAARSTRKSGNAIARWFFATLAVGFGVIVYGYLTLPDVRPLATSNPTTTAFMELRAEEARSHGKPPRKVQRWIKYSRISPDLKRAVLVAEDAAFWQHDGVDYDELQKSIELDWARGQLLRGASTITQQLAKNLYLSPSRNPLRKLRELVITRRLEAELQKARILELYLNLIEWGDGVYGVEAASQTYFGQSASALGPTASALLAGAIVNPRLLSPAHPTARLVRRQQMILKRMGAVTPPVEVAVPPAQQPSPAAPVIAPSDAPPDVLPSILAPVPPESPPTPPVEPK